MKNKRALLGLYSLLCLSAIPVGIVLTFAVSVNVGAIVFGSGFVGFGLAVVVGCIWNRRDCR